MPRPAGRFSGARDGIGGLWTAKATGTSTALAGNLEPLLHRPAATALTLALRGIAAAYLGRQCLDPARLRDTWIPAASTARFLTVYNCRRPRGRN
ncbi:hypothetical protein ACQKWADRAFT_215552 [Trichoderma austrokoningii]